MEWMNSTLCVYRVWVSFSAVRSSARKERLENVACNSTFKTGRFCSPHQFEASFSLLCFFNHNYHPDTEASQHNSVTSTSQKTALGGRGIQKPLWQSETLFSKPKRLIPQKLENEWTRNTKERISINNRIHIMLDKGILWIENVNANLTISLQFTMF